MFSLYFAGSTCIAQSSQYSELKVNVETKRMEFKRKYIKTICNGNKELIIIKATKYLLKRLIDDFLPAWLGTPWSFNGRTRTPHVGSIACGFFVVHVLQDLGFKMPSKMARQPSENIIKNLTGRKNIKRFSNTVSLEQLKDWMIKSGEGIYIVGLDIHVGFIIYKKNKITFFHSSYYNPHLKVVEQDLMEKSPLTDSKYRVLGKIFDVGMIKRWLTGDSFPLKYNYYKTL